MSDPQRIFKILLAEDSPENRLVMKKYLERSPFVLTIALDGQSAVEQFQNGCFDLILMDIQMPFMDGLSATRAIRQIEQERGAIPVPIVALTASAWQEDIRKTRLAGCSEHLSKPISKRTLLDSLGRHLGWPAEQNVAPNRRPECAPPRPAAPTPVSPELNEFVPEYVRVIKQYAADMSTLLKAGDFERIRSLAHNIKGTGGSYGFPELTHLAAALENSATTLDAHALKEAISKLTSYLEELPS